MLSALCMPMTALLAKSQQRLSFELAFDSFSCFDFFCAKQTVLIWLLGIPSRAKDFMVVALQCRGDRMRQEQEPFVQ
jgi:hypothetical protein